MSTIRTYYGNDVTTWFDTSFRQVVTVIADYIGANTVDISVQYGIELTKGIFTMTYTTNYGKRSYFAPSDEYPEANGYITLTDPIHYATVEYGKSVQVTAYCGFNSSGIEYTSTANITFDTEMVQALPLPPKNLHLVSTGFDGEYCTINLAWENDFRKNEVIRDIRYLRYVRDPLTGADGELKADRNNLYSSGFEESYSDLMADPNSLYNVYIIPKTDVGQAPKDQCKLVVKTPHKPPVEPQITGNGTTESSMDFTLYVAGKPVEAASRVRVLIKNILTGTLKVLFDETRAGDVQWTKRITVNRLSEEGEQVVSVEASNDGGVATKVVGSFLGLPKPATKATYEWVSLTTCKIEVSGGTSYATNVNIFQGEFAGQGTPITAPHVLPVTTFMINTLEQPLSDKVAICMARSATLNSSPLVLEVNRPQQPDKPTITEPAGQVLPPVAGDVRVAWRHIPRDNSAQSAAELQYSFNGEPFKTLTFTTQTSAILKNPGVEGTLSLRVRTRGIHASFSPWSDTVAYHIKPSPSVEITSDSLPIGLQPVYIKIRVVNEIASSVKVEVKDGSSTLFSKYVMFRGEDRDATIRIDGTETPWITLPAMGKTYTVFATVEFDLSGYITATKSVLFDFPPSKPASVDVDADSDTGYVRLVARVAEDAPGDDITSIDIWREVEGAPDKLIASGLHKGDVVIDKHAPLNKLYRYRTVGHSTNGSARFTYSPGSIKTPYCFFYFGDGDIARAELDPQESLDLTRPARTLVSYIGRDFPVAYDSSFKSDVRRVSGHLIGQAERDAFMRLNNSTVCVFKSLGGDVFRAVADVHLELNHVLPTRHTDVEVSITRISGEAL